MGTLQEIAAGIFLIAHAAVLIALFIKGSRPPQPLEIQPQAYQHPLANAVVAIISPGVSMDASISARTLGLVAVIVCVPFAIGFLFITMFGIG